MTWDAVDLELRMVADGGVTTVGGESHSISVLASPSGRYRFESGLHVSDGCGGHIERVRTRFDATFDDEFALLSGDYSSTTDDALLAVTIARDATSLVISIDEERRRIDEGALPIVPSYVLAQLPVLLEQRSMRTFDCLLFDEGLRTTSVEVQLRRVHDVAMVAPPNGVTGAVAAWQQATADQTILVTTYLAEDGSLLANDYGGAWAVRA